MKEAGQYINLRIRRNNKWKAGDKASQFYKGADVYIPSDVLCKALRQSAIPCDTLKLKCKLSACKDGKRAKIMIHVMKA